MEEKEKIAKMIDGLLEEVEEEDVGISLFQIFCENKEELGFFIEEDRKRVVTILQKLSSDSKLHKKLLGKLVDHLGRKYHED